MDKIPDSIKIGGHIFTIEFKSEKRDGFDAVGWQKGIENRIIIQEDKICFSKKESTLLHEVIHEISDQNNLSLTEQQVSSLGEGLYQVLTDNNLSFGKKR